MFIVLIASYSNSGKRQCDAKCYNAGHGDCNCCCGGLNHGVGLSQATENTKSLADTIKEFFTNQDKAQESNSTFIDPSVFQLSFFGWLN